MTDARRCQASNLDGKPCGQATVGENGLCLWHDPARAAEAADARRRGQDRYREVKAEERQRAAVTAAELPPDLELNIPALLRRAAWVHQQLAAGLLKPTQAGELNRSLRLMLEMVTQRDVEDRLSEALAELKELRRKLGIRRIG